MATDPITLTLAHSPDPDDAFMWWPLGDVAKGVEPRIDTEGLRFRTVAEDIEALNRRAVEVGDLDITALSFHAYAHCAERYVLTRCGASFGDGYGPKIVARAPIGPERLRDPRVVIAIPGERTTAYLTMRLMLGTNCVPRTIAAPFHRIIDMVKDASGAGADAGIVIHEAQLTYADAGVHLVVDLGAWWHEQTGLPLPLGANGIRADLDARFGAGTMDRVARVLKASIVYANAHRADGLAVAGGFAQPGTTAAQADRFVAMYVNDLTIDAGERGHRGVAELMRQGRAAGLLPDLGEVRMVGA